MPAFYKRAYELCHTREEFVELVKQARCLSPEVADDLRPLLSGRVAFALEQPIRESGHPIRYLTAIDANRIAVPGFFRFGGPCGVQQVRRDYSHGQDRGEERPGEDLSSNQTRQSHPAPARLIARAYGELLGENDNLSPEVGASFEYRSKANRLQASTTSGMPASADDSLEGFCCICPILQRSASEGFHPFTSVSIGP